jgi:tetratricopeptide (TPR) repeat protein
VLRETIGSAGEQGRSDDVDRRGSPALESTHGHLSPEVMAEWLNAYSAEPAGLQVIEHIAAHCAACRASYQELERMVREVRHWDPRVAVFEGKQALDLWRTLEPLAPPERMERVRQDDFPHSWGLCRLLQRLSMESVGERPDEAALLVELALAAWRGIGALPAYGAGWLADLRAELLACRSVARRALGELHAADADCGEAAVALQDGTGDPGVAAGIDLLTALVRRDQRRGEEAFALLDRAFEVYAQASAGERERHLAGETLATRAWCLRLEDRAAEALPFLRQALALVEEKKNRRLALGIRGEQVGCLLAAGRTAEAAVAAGELATSVESLGGDARDRARALWAAGRVAAGKESWNEAEEALAAAAGELRRVGQGCEGALALSALGGVRAAQGGDPSPLAAELFPVVATGQLNAEQVVTLFAFGDACRERTLTPALAQELAARLERQGAGRLPWSPSLP